MESHHRRLDSGLSVSLDIRNLILGSRAGSNYTAGCVEGWSAIAWWAGFRFDDLLRAYPPIVASEMGVREIISQPR